MLHALLDPKTNEPRSPGFWWAAAAAVLVLFAAFWHVCSQQVARAENRSTEAQLAQAALADCLQYIPGSTVASCVQRIAPQPATHTAAAEGATPVNYTFR